MSEQPLTAEELAAITERDRKIKQEGTIWDEDIRPSVYDRRKLLAEIARLRAEVAALTAERDGLARFVPAATAATEDAVLERTRQQFDLITSEAAKMVRAATDRAEAAEARLAQVRGAVQLAYTVLRQGPFGGVAYQAATALSNALDTIDAATAPAPAEEPREAGQAGEGERCG